MIQWNLVNLWIIQGVTWNCKLIKVNVGCYLAEVLEMGLGMTYVRFAWLLCSVASSNYIGRVVLPTMMGKVSLYDDVGDDDDCDGEVLRHDVRNGGLYGVGFEVSVACKPALLEWYTTLLLLLLLLWSGKRMARDYVSFPAGWMEYLRVAHRLSAWECTLQCKWLNVMVNKPGWLFKFNEWPVFVCECAIRGIQTALPCAGV